MRALLVTNLYPGPRSPTSGTFIERQVYGLQAIGLTTELMFLDRIGEGRSAYVGLGRKIKNALLRFEPDVVHVLYGGIMADKITRAVEDRPVIVSFCGTDLLGEPLVGWFQKLSSGYNVWASHRAAKRASGIVVKSQNLFDALPNRVDRAKVRIIPNGVDLERFKPMSRSEARQILGWPEDSAVVLFVTVRGHPRKRLGLAEEAVAKIPPCGRKIDFRIMQGVSHEQVPVWLNAADALILTSVHEGSANIVKEAMACNLPIVSVDVGDVRERLNGVHLCTIAAETPEALGSALSATLRAGERSNGRDHLEALSLTAVARDLERFYSQVQIDFAKTRRHRIGELRADTLQPSLVAAPNPNKEERAYSSRQ